MASNLSTNFTSGATDPITAYKYRVRISLQKGPDINLQFSRVSGFESAIDVIEYREGTDPVTPRVLPGLMKFGPVTFERGVTFASDDLIKWHKRCINTVGTFGGGGGKDGTASLYRGTVTTTVYGRDGFAFREYTLRRAIATTLRWSDLDGLASETFIETLEVRHEGLEVEDLSKSHGGGGGVIV